VKESFALLVPVTFYQKINALLSLATPTMATLLVTVSLCLKPKWHSWRGCKQCRDPILPSALTLVLQIEKATCMESWIVLNLSVVSREFFLTEKGVRISLAAIVAP
jgi:hypothetical protein